MSKNVEIGPRGASRYIDDYTITAADGTSGEALIAALRQAASAFELELNNEKSAILSTATRHDGGWKQEVRAYVPRDSMDASQFLLFFYRIGRICEAHPDVNVEKYALTNARSAFVNADGWKTIQSHLISAYRRNASLISFLVEIMILRQAKRGDVDTSSLAEFISHRLPTLAENNRTGEIVWLLLLAIRMGIKQRAKDLGPMLELDNSMISLLLAASGARNLLDGSLDFSKWNHSLNSDGLRTGMWLFAYESVAQGFNPSTSTAFIEQDQYFSLLLQRGVRFLSLDSGFISIESTLRSLRIDNSRQKRVRDEFAEDFEIDIEELDDDDEDPDEDDDDAY